MCVFILGIEQNSNRAKRPSVYLLLSRNFNRAMPIDCIDCLVTLNVLLVIAQASVNWDLRWAKARALHVTAATGPSS